jgi:hypothetical protein
METAANAPRGMPIAEDARDCCWSRARLLHRGDERAPGTGGYAQRLPVAVLGVSHHHGVDRTGDLYALATVRT